MERNASSRALLSKIKDVLLRVLVIVQKLLQENRHGSKRDIYYMHPSVFSEQSVVDRAINDICILLQCSRHNLNVVSVGNGLVMGWLRFLEAGRKFDCINSPTTAYTIPVHVEEVKDIVSVAKYILIVEKESGKRVSRYSHQKVEISVLFLRLLVEKLCLPVYCLVDCDPYGFDILTTYRFGSMQMAFDAKVLRVPEVQWLGAFPSDFEKYDLPQQCLLPLTAEDKRRTETMLLRCYLQKEVPEWRLELELMLQKGVKFEIEAFSVHTLSFLSEQYIPSKIPKVEVLPGNNFKKLKSSIENEMKLKYLIEKGRVHLFRSKAIYFFFHLTYEKDEEARGMSSKVGKKTPFQCLPYWVKNFMMFLVTIANQIFMTTIDSPKFSDVSGIKSLLLPQETLFQV
ncbi:meiotic recombination protein SPO11-1 isoform X1 [Populus alba x Populus x berolinensis]|uniref:DNA topoisomerase (ATP-hydrolyzing) n=1 Tax=Populus alba x Populus x berolinensis TaxID=444605 RepID=A0AAD6WIS5_9ROSI|nr:meiotic recombination protein SPO11-1 isoform X1 [Populus alba x Populus x berolinensis]